MTTGARRVIRALGASCVVGLLIAVAPAVALAAPGALDGSYATGGVFTGSFQTEPAGAPSRDQTAAVDSQGRTVIAATHVDAQNRRHLDVMRLTSQGTLDASFNASGPTPGVVEVDFSAYVNTIDVYARGVAVVGGDKIVALGWVHDTNGDNFTALVRLGSDGSYDQTFGPNHDGRAVDLGSPNYAGFPDSLAVDNLGRILVGGSCGSTCLGIVARYTNTGSRDSSGFNTTDPVHPGVVVIDQGSDVSSLALATDGSNDILAADGNSSSDDAVIARIRPDGTLDPTFGSTGPTPGVVDSGMGRQLGGNSGGAFAFGVAAGPAGTVYATGQVSDPGGAQSMRLLRLTQAGNPDPGFGSGNPATGVVAAPGGIRGVSVAIDGSACPVVVGYGLRSDQQVPNTQIVAARFTGAGQLDQAFNPSGASPGTATFPLGSRALGETVALQADGKIVIGGEADQIGAATIRNAVALRLQGGGCGTVVAPTVVTGQATNVSSDGATLNGTVNPNGSQVSDCHFDYGTSPQYGNRAVCSPTPGAGSSSVAVSATLSGLGSGKTWDYRLVATGPGGTSTGGNQTLTTLTAPASTTLTTTQTWQATQGPSITVPFDATGERDEATITGNNTFMALGTVTFALYSDPQCTQASQVFTSTNRLAGNPGPFSLAESDPVSSQLPSGTYYWTAAYTGDSRNQPSSSPCGDETLTVASRTNGPAPTTVTTSQTAGSAHGASITVPHGTTGETDQATITGNNTFMASGTVTFALYSDSQCAQASQVFTSTNRLAATPGLFSLADSSPVTHQLDPGTYYWVAAYTGDSRNQGSTSSCGSETLTVQPPAPTSVSTQQFYIAGIEGDSIAVPAGATTERDEATITGQLAPSGTVAFSLYSNAQCTGTPVFSSTNPVSGVTTSGFSTSDVVGRRLTPGTYYWTAAYSGDANNLPGTSPCGSETLTVQPPASTSVSTHQFYTAGVEGDSITVPAGATTERDNATITGQFAPSGTVVFRLYSNAKCTGTPVFSSTNAASGANTSGFSTSDVVGRPLAPGTYYWTATYSGDANNLPTSSPCGAETLTVQPPAPTTLTTSQVWVGSGSPPTAAGGPNITVPAGATGELDQSTITGPNASHASGTVTFRLYSGPACTAATLVPGASSTSTVQDTSLSAFASSAPVTTPLSPGTYYWKAAYSGDGDDQASRSPCGAETLTVAPVHFGGPAFSNGSVITLVMSCLLPCQLRITVTAPALRLASDARVTERTKSRARVLTLARGSVTIRKHGQQKVNLRLTSAGRRFIATHGGRVTVTVAIAMTVDGHTRVLTRRLPLTVAKRRLR